ncbi:MAG: hypothetical protein ABL903_14315 [Methylococcales bacterium]
MTLKTSKRPELQLQDKVYGPTLQLRFWVWPKRKIEPEQPIPLLQIGLTVLALLVGSGIWFGCKWFMHNEIGSNTSIRDLIFNKIPNAPPIPYQDFGACPFEYCKYGKWIAKKETSIRTDMQKDSPISFTIKPGEIVSAFTGVVITSKPGKAKVIKPIVFGDITANVGDIVYLLTNHGEGVSTIWYKGRSWESDFDMTVNLEYLKRSESVWWVKIKSNLGQIGWSNEASNFGNKDVCGDYTPDPIPERITTNDSKPFLFNSNPKSIEAQPLKQSKQINTLNVGQQTNEAPVAPIHKQGDTYTLESVNLDNVSINSTTERKVISSNSEKIMIESRNVQSKSGLVRKLEFTPEWNLIAVRNSDGSGVNYSPPLTYYKFPLTSGKTWQQTSIETNIKTSAIREHTLSAFVGNWENITVPAGTFRGVKVTIQTELVDRTTGQKTMSTDTSWYVPEVRRSVRSLTSSRSPEGVESRQDLQLIRYDLIN